MSRQDYDAFYATCAEIEHPGLRGHPVGVRQKQVRVSDFAIKGIIHNAAFSSL